ncbi:MAG: hypothetical protein IJA10_08520 [Lachnospiraceae bacterium]|nr:hypothetical protein [Lachnospiraceae bacterium]
MKQSIWLKNYEREVQGKKEQSNQGKKIILLIIPVMLLLIIIAAMENGGMSDPQAKSGLLFTVGIVVFIMVLVAVILGKNKKTDVAKRTRESVLDLLKTDEDVDLFDQQMSAEPIMNVKIGLETVVFLTRDYVVEKYMINGNVQYCFIRRKDVVTFNFCKAPSTGVNPLRASYAFDIKNAQKKVIMNGIAENGEQLDQLVELIKEAQQDVSVIKK